MKRVFTRAARIWSLTLVLVTLMPLASQAAPEQAISLQWAQEQAYAHSSEKQALDLERDNLKAVIDELAEDPNLYLPWNEAKLLVLKATDKQLTKVLRAYATVEAAAKNRVTDAYAALLLSQRQVTVQSAALQMLNDKYFVEVERLKLGVSTELTVKALELKLRQARLGLTEAEDILIQMQMQFNALVGRDLWDDVTLEDLPAQGLAFSPEEIDFSSSLSTALAAEHGAAREMRQAYQDAKKDYDELYNPAFDVSGEGAKKSDIREARLKFKQAENAYSQFVQSFTMSHWRDYRQVQNLEEAVYIAEEELKLERRRLTVEEHKAEAGLASTEQLVEQLSRTVQKELDYNKCVEAYNKALRSFRLTEHGK